jgi:Carboxypeptidase regulatory-like domain
MSKNRFKLVVAAMLVSLSGCGEHGGIRTVPVGGTVTYKGAPVEGATVSFIPDGPERPATAISAANGKYDLATLDSEGAMAGKYTVLVRKMNVASSTLEPVSMEDALKLNSRPVAAPKDLLPAKYGDVGRSPLKYEVKAGSKNVFDLQLTD